MNIFTNGSFVSCDDKKSNFSNLITERGKIIFTGNTIPDKYNGIKQIDLGGKLVLPSFFDTHIHFSSFSYFNRGLDLRTAQNFKQLGAIINSYIGDCGNEKIILGFGCSAHTLEEKRLPTNDDLDLITSHPLLIIKYDGHAAIGNSALLKQLPSHILKERGFDKRTGQFYQESFYEAVNYISKKISLSKIFTNLIEGSNELLRNGISYIHAVEGVGIPFDIDLMRFAARGLPISIKTFFQTMDVNKVTKRNMNCIGGCFKTALDGCFGSLDAALKSPYLNDSKNTGVLFNSQDVVTNFVKKAHNKGLQIALHAIGDAAIEQALNAFEFALKENPKNDHRHIIIHADLMDQQMIERTANLGISITLQTPFLQWDLEPISYLESILGDRVNNLIPLKSMLKAGIQMANGSDAPTTLPNPIEAIHAACNHPNSDESIDIMDAIKMHTSNGAKLSFEENNLGTLTEGKDANFVVLDKNILKLPKEEIKIAKVDEVYIKGERPKDLTGKRLKYVIDCVRNNKN